MPKKRRTVKSIKTALKVKADGKKIELKYAKDHRAPETCEQRSLITHDIGNAMRTFVPMTAPTFNKLKPHEKAAVENYLSVIVY